MTTLDVVTAGPVIQADAGLQARFARGVSINPYGTAIQAGPRTVSYTEGHELALRWAGSLRRVLPRSAPVAVLAGRSAEAYLGILSCLYAGATAAPMLTDFPVARLVEMIRAAGVRALIVDAEGAALLPALREHGVDLPTLVAAGDAEVTRPIVTSPAHRLDRPWRVDPQDIAYILFTSGSTGTPKGVRLSHANLTHYFDLMDRWYDFTAADVFSQAANLNWDSAVSDLWCAWGAGARLVAVLGPHYRDLPGFVAEHGVTVWFSAPSTIGLVRRTGKLTPNAMPTLRWTYFGGEALRWTDTADWQAAAPNSSVVNVYGPTEITITTHRHTWSPAVSTALGVNGVVPLGHLHDGHHQRIIEGELYIAGPQVSAGYLDPRHEAGRYLEIDGRTYYRTGDLVREVAGGELVYLGRADSQVQVHGLRVELGELDHAVRACPGVEDAVTVGAAVGGTTELLVFYTGERQSPAVLARHIGRTVPRQLVPKHYRHVTEFPLNTNKKIDRLRLTAEATTQLRTGERS
ncbi:amino acid adenylation domain-containing protein [Actinoplanes octamycinicus]|uniref:Amino acid adenylation domain-containing protein n=1 Tax=Actinoplanes octamycinicus TaxID=135948 RepID=A0A7W7H849_9ACTN|nr:AMP-binding protein [Actinoplanes octamycinicus]MBB4745791.1 amino acid adenylation domain-containing protein [Actinoplanes octamycinicus]GIE63863.1 amino acid adenylation protein [Actinoplanes octamycinicus]